MPNRLLVAGVLALLFATSPPPVEARCAFGELVVTTVVPNPISSAADLPCDAVERSDEVVDEAQDGDRCDGYWACYDISFVNHYADAGLVYCGAGILRRLHLVTF